jgi:hypothetical protein
MTSIDFDPLPYFSFTRTNSGLLLSLEKQVVLQPFDGLLEHFWNTMLQPSRAVLATGGY